MCLTGMQLAVQSRLYQHIKNMILEAFFLLLILMMLFWIPQ